MAQARFHPENDMKLYYTPGVCSLSPHIALHEAGLAHESIKVDLRAKKLENGDEEPGRNDRQHEQQN